MSPVFYKKRPVIVQAMQWTGDNYNEIEMFVGKHVLTEGQNYYTKKPELVLRNKDDNIKYARPGDYVIKDMQGNLTFCVSDKFAEEYDIMEVRE